MATGRRRTIGEVLSLIGPDDAQDNICDEVPILIQSPLDVYPICYGEPERLPRDDYDGTLKEDEFRLHTPHIPARIVASPKKR